MIVPPADLQACTLALKWWSVKGNSVLHETIKEAPIGDGVSVVAKSGKDTFGGSLLIDEPNSRRSCPVSGRVHAGKSWHGFRALD